MTTIIDSVSGHMNFIFQILVVASIVLIMVQIKTFETADYMRWGIHARWEFTLRKAALFMKMLVLTAIVIYADIKEWPIWPPFVAFLMAFDLYVVSHIVIMRNDIKRMDVLRQISGQTPSRSV